MASLQPISRHRASGKLCSGLAQQTPPYLLPYRATLSTFRSRSRRLGVAGQLQRIGVRGHAHLEVDNDQYRPVARNLTEEIVENVACNFVEIRNG